MIRLRRAVASVLVAAAVTVVAPAGAPAQGARGLSAVSPPFSAPPARGATGAADLTSRINALSSRPTVSPPAAPVGPPGMVWVPDRYAPVPGVPEGAFVPGHWEQPLPNGQVYVPPIVVVTPPGVPGMVPAGERPPVDARIGP